MLYFNCSSETHVGLTCGDTVEPSTLNLYRNIFVAAIGARVWQILIVTFPMQNEINLYDAVAFHISYRVSQSQNLINMLLLLILITTLTKHFIMDNKH